MTTENALIIFHRSKQNAEKSLANQKAFLENYKQHFASPKVFDYVIGNFNTWVDIRTSIIKRMPDKKCIIIINNYLPKQEFMKQYDMYYFFNFLKVADMADIYLMDSEGRLYREVTDIESIAISN